MAERPRVAETAARGRRLAGLRAGLIAAVTLLAVAGCGPTAEVAWPPVDAGPLKPVWVVRHGWHTRVAVRRADVDPASWPESRELGEVAYLEAGWGDRDFYPKPDPSLLDAIDPVIRPTPAALHVGGFDVPPPRFLPGVPVVRLEVPAPGVDRLARFIHRHYEPGPDGRPVRIRAGHYERSWFYLARGRYHALFNNSNHWTARALRAAGVPVSRSGAATAGGVLAQAARLGEVVGGDTMTGSVR